MPVGFQSGLRLVDWVSSGALVDLDFANNRFFGSSGGSLSSYLTISRASTGYAKTSGGLLTQFSSNQFRLTDRGLLIEDARTNIVFRSEELQTWTLANVSITQNATIAPDGATTADKIVSGTGSGTHTCYQERPGNLTSGNVTFSCFFKAAGYNYGVLSVYNDSDLGRYGIVVNLTTGAITSTNTTGTITVVQSGSAEAYGNGWWRVSLVIDGGMKGVQTGACDVASPTWTGAGSCMPTWSGNGTDGVYAWGLQVEGGSFPSSYILCTTGATARAADSVTISGPAQTLINNATGSIVAWVNGSPTSIFPANVVDSNGTNLLGYDATDHGLTSITSALATSNIANPAGRDKFGISWDASGRSLVLNAGTVATDAVAQTPSATQKLGSAGATSNFIYAYVDRLALWNSKLSNASLQGFTT